MNVWQVLYLIAPLVVAGMVHSVVIKRNLFTMLVRPLDGGRTFGERPVFGPNKTWRGAIVMALTTVTVVGIQRLLESVPALAGLSPVDYAAVQWPLVGLAMALGYTLGELPNSFVKRRLGIAPGGRGAGAAAQYIIDQADSAVGVALALALFPGLPVRDLLAVVAVGTLVHAAFDAALYALGVKSKVLPDIRSLGRPGRRA